MMSPIRKNVVANCAGSFWTALMSVIFIPLYIKFMGIEAYGLVGVFASLLAVFSVLDMGLSATMTREMARLSALDPSGRETHGLSRTLEVIYWSVAILLGVAVIGLAGPIADYWVKSERLDPGVVKQALVITGGVVALRWPVAFYSGGLRGLDRQPLLNLIQSLCSTLRGLGSVAVLWLISPTIQAYFSYQIVVSAIETSCLAVALWRSLPGGKTGSTFSLAHLKRVWRFSAGMTGISVMALLLTQTDKIILSKMLSLELFGYYTLAWQVSSTLMQIVRPIDSAVYPTLTRLVSQESEQELHNLYHRSSQMETVLVAPAAAMLALFSDAILMLWSGHPELASNTGPILSILAVGYCLNCFMHIPYLAQLAYGWTSLTFYQNLVSVMVLVPLMVLLTQLYQGIGAAYVWVILNAGYVLISIHIMHRRILKNAKWDWYIYDVGLPTVATLGASFAGFWLMPLQLSGAMGGAYLCVVGMVSVAAGLMAASALRPTIVRRLRMINQRVVVGFARITQNMYGS